MHVRLWAALSGAVLFTLIAASATFLWLCLPAVWGPDGIEGRNMWMLRATAGALCVMTAVFGLALARIAFTLFPNPQGFTLHRVDAPKLWNEVDRVASALGAPRVHRIVVDGRVGAAVCSRRSWLLFSWRHCLVLGLPLLRALPPEEMRAVIAHELAHLMRGDTILGRSVYRAHALWGKLDGIATRRPQGILERAIRRAARCGHVVSRRHRLASERAADAACLRVVSASVTARALVRSFIAQRQVAESVRDWTRQAHGTGHAIPSDFLERVDAFLKHVDPRANAWLAEELCEVTWPSDSHPCLRDRVRALIGALEVQAPAPIAERESAASAWLGTVRWSAARALSESWRRENMHHWQRQCALQTEWRKRAEALQSRLDELQPLELRQLALLRHALMDLEALGPVLARLVRADPDDAESLMRLAELRLERPSIDDEIEARGMLSRATELQPELEANCLMILGAWHARSGRAALARRTFEQAVATSRRTNRRRALEPATVP